MLDKQNEHSCFAWLLCSSPPRNQEPKRDEGQEEPSALLAGERQLDNQLALPGRTCLFFLVEENTLFLGVA